MSSDDKIDPIRVHLTGSDVPLNNQGDKNPCRRGLTTRSFNLTAADPVQQILPNNLNRITAYVRPEQNAITIAASQADALAGANSAAKISASSFQPQELPTTDEVWATSSTLPTVVDVIAIIQGP